ncbi:hypothetical protein BDW67DRAFT_60743 [Aspergillus spinulosporus]
MPDVKTLRSQLTQAAASARVVVRCLNNGRDLQESSQRAIMLLVDTIDSLHRLKEQMCCCGRDEDEDEDKDEWIIRPARLAALAEILDCFAATMTSMERYFQPGGVGVTFYRKHLLDRTFLGRLESYKVMLLLAMQKGSRFVSSCLLCCLC